MKTNPHLKVIKDLKEEEGLCRNWARGGDALLLLHTHITCHAMRGSGTERTHSDSQTITSIIRHVFPEKNVFSGELLAIPLVSALSIFLHFQICVIYGTLIFKCLSQELSLYKVQLSSLCRMKVS